MKYRELEDALDQIARDGGVKPEEAFYIWGELHLTQSNGESLYSDEAHEYCWDCAKKLLAKALPLLPEEQREDHGISATDLNGEDSCANCMVCGELLDYSLSSHGVASELDHYEFEGLGPTLKPGDAFHIARMVEGLVEADPDTVKRVVRIAKRALAIAPAHRAALSA